MTQDVGRCTRWKVSSLLGERPSQPGHVSFGHGSPTDYVVVPPMIMCRGGVALSPSAGSQPGICEHSTVRWAAGTGRLGLRCECPAHLHSAQTLRPIPPTMLCSLDLCSFCSFFNAIFNLLLLLPQSFRKDRKIEITYLLLSKALNDEDKQ